MVITWYGEGCFKIQIGAFAAISDPFESSTGLTPARGKADLTIKTLTAYPIAFESADQTRSVIGPGEYEVAGVEIRGWQVADADASFLRTVYRAKFEDLNLGFLGHLEREPAASIIEELGGVDVLFIPAGGPPLLGVEAAARLIKQLNPRLVVASFFKIPGLKRRSDGVEAFLKELGQRASAQEKLVIKHKDLPATTQVAVLHP